MENPIKMNDLGGKNPLFLETPISSIPKIPDKRAYSTNLNQPHLSPSDPFRFLLWKFDLTEPPKSHGSTLKNPWVFN